MTVIEPALHEALRALKLSGMLQTLDSRLAQARAGELGHLDFLQVLCHDEIGRREATAMGRRLRRAHFDAQTTLEDFDFHASSKLPAAQIRDLAALRWLHAAESVILYGPVGVGKTHIAQALGTWQSGTAPTFASPRPAGCWPIWPVGTPMAPGVDVYASWPGRRC